MITHKEAIKILEFGQFPSEFGGYCDISFKESNEIIILLKSELWHKYPDEKPKENKSYLTAFPNGLVEQNRFEKGHFLAFDKVVFAWRKFPKYESEVKE